LDGKKPQSLEAILGFVLRRRRERKLRKRDISVLERAWPTRGGNLQKTSIPKKREGGSQSVKAGVEKRFAVAEKIFYSD